MFLFADNDLTDTLIDRILSECECLKRSVVNILEIYTQMTEVADYLSESK